ncbi:MAG: class Ib ribonucleoside-diphosphate reductase assembly flavoprotein NrdI [Coprobacillaceae bacterium]
MKVVYYSVTGQVKRFIQKLDMDVYQIDNDMPCVEINEEFVLIVPTYDEEMTTVVNTFLDYKSNTNYFKGVIGSGNRNFAELFVFTAKTIAKKYNVPLLYAFEYSGTKEDIDNVRKVVKEIES